ncbi:Cytochrome P450 2 sub R member 1 [Chamberlinius hualienensis]
MDFLSILGWNATIICLSVTYWYMSVPKNLPPGSAGIPILGYLPFLDRQIHFTFTKLKKKFGGLFYLYFGSRLVLVLNDFEVIKEALLKHGDAFSGRSPNGIFDEVVGDSYSGIVMTDGDYWKQHRRFILRNLRDNGVGKLELEPLVLNEIQHFLNEVQKHVGKGPFELKNYLFSSMTNNIHILVSGKRYDYNQPAIHRMMQLSKDFDKLAQGIPYETFFPYFKTIIGMINLNNIKQLRDVKRQFMNIVIDTINEAKANSITDQRENYIQAYVNESKKNEKIFKEMGLVHNTRDLLIAGSDTSATTLAWAALYMAKFQEIQKKVQDEIDKVIGQREPSYNDRNNTPYTEATICELHRVISLAPLTIPHRVTEDTTLNGYNIPKDTMVFPNIWAVHNDEKLWGDPKNFRPERFIGPNGDCVKPEYLLPFSMGKRACAGEPLARMELYLYFVSLMQNFTFLPPNGEEITFESPPGFTRQPQIKLICVKSRPK